MPSGPIWRTDVLARFTVRLCSDKEERMRVRDFLISSLLSSMMKISSRKAMQFGHVGGGSGIFVVER